MDVVTSRRSDSDDVSCQCLSWAFDLCARRNIDPGRIGRNVSYSLSHLRDPSKFIDWQSFATYISNLGNYLDEAELFDAGRHSWDSGNLRIYSYVGRLLFSVRDQYLELFGPLGAVVRLYPFELSIIQLSANSLRIHLTMNQGCKPCYTFHLLLAGQMAGLPESLGYPSAEVTTNHLENGASFDISFSNKGGLLAPIRKAATWFFTARKTAKELTTTYGELLDKYQELQEETRKLRIAEQRAEESNERYLLIANSVNDIIWIMDTNLEFRYVSPAVLPITGYSEEEIQQIRLTDLLTPDSMEQLRSNFAGFPQETPDTITLEVELRHKEGHGIWVEIKASFQPDMEPPGSGPSGSPGSGSPGPAGTGMVTGVARDITDRKLMEHEINEREMGYRIITNTAQDAIITIDTDNAITFANPASVRVFGYEIHELIGMNITHLMPEALGDVHLREFYRSVECEPRSGVELKALRKDRTLVPLEMSFARHQLHGDIYRTCFIRDVSMRNEVELERKKLEQQLLASQKMESIGQLTGGIAHDFNNLLVAILGYSDLALAPDTSEESVREYLAEIKQAGERAADMTQKLLAFSRRQIIEPTLIDTHELIQGLDLMIRRLLPENIDVTLRSGDGELNVMADSGQLEQVLVNLAVNARDAMPAGGKLVIETSREVIDERSLSRKPFASAGEYVTISVSDTGTGMGEEIRKRIFEPFFTTKPEGSGTGLGLSVVFGIIRQHDGFIDIESEVGKGTTFTVYLPLVHSRARPVTSEVKRHVLGGNETIFIVEDNHQVRGLARLILKGAGYNVIEATDGVEALEIFRKHADGIDLVVMDVVMPRMGGKEVMKRIREINPGIRIVFTSGYSASGIHTNFILEEGLEFIPKPYSTEVLRSRIREVLDNPPATGIAASRDSV